MPIDTLNCGCELVSDDDLLASVSWCRYHAPKFLRRLYACGECGWVSHRFDRLERHVYAVHLGAQVA
jgi:hypothetical protein